MSIHTDHAQQLAALYRQRKRIEIQVAHRVGLLDARALTITPPDGWPGKNEAERKTARDKAIADDPACRVIIENLTVLRDDLARIEGEIAAAEALRRGAEWETREGLRLAFAQTDSSSGPAHEPADAAFEATVQAATARILEYTNP
jgi:hypothetical protein